MCPAKYFALRPAPSSPDGAGMRSPTLTVALMTRGEVSSGGKMSELLALCHALKLVASVFVKLPVFKFAFSQEKTRSKATFSFEVKRSRVRCAGNAGSRKV